MATTNSGTIDTTKQAKEMASNLSWLPKKTFELEITIPQDLVKKTYDKVLTRATENTTIKGFRKGKAPKELVEKQIGKEQLYEDVVQELVSVAYYQALKQHNLHPIIDPLITPVSLKENSDWVVKASACEAPEVKLNSYKDAVKGLRAKKSLWTPDKAGKEEPKEGESATKPTTEEIFEELLKVTEVELPDMLVDSETNRLLSNTVDQVIAAGLTMQQYLEGKHLTQDQLRESYEKSAIQSLKLEFILAKIAEEEKIVITTNELDDMISKTNDPYAKKALENPQQKLYLSLLMRKQKTVDYLKGL